MDTSQFNGAFWLAISASVSAFIVVIITALNKSKCSNISCCCGVFACVRDTHAEAKIEEKAIELEEIKIGHRLSEIKINVKDKENENFEIEGVKH
tara:strand:+ start:2323 stop:2607 length:285 start_codon:yes stop_codon:yes gene_type:complete